MANTDATPDMYERLYWEIQAVLDEVLGTDDDGAGEAGIVSDVRRALAKVRADEREACAQLCEQVGATFVSATTESHSVVRPVADLIRTRTT